MKIVNNFCLLSLMLWVTLSLWGCNLAGATTPSSTFIPVSTPVPLFVRPIKGASGRIAFHSDRLGMDAIYVINVNNSNPDMLLISDTQQPAWAPSGKKIAFVIINDKREYEICVANDDGSNQIRLTDGNNYSPVWSPDGKKIAFVSGRDGNDEIYIMNADGTNQTSAMTNEKIGVRSDNFVPEEV
jgi:hypothetical protein